MAALVFASWLLLTVAQSPTSPPPVVVVFETELGTIEIQVNVAQAPGTAANFLKYVEGTFYDGGV